MRDRSKVIEDKVRILEAIRGYTKGSEQRRKLSVELQKIDSELAAIRFRENKVVNIAQEFLKNFYFYTKLEMESDQFEKLFAKVKAMSIVQAMRVGNQNQHEATENVDSVIKNF